MSDPEVGLPPRDSFGLIKSLEAAVRERGERSGDVISQDPELAFYSEDVARKELFEACIEAIAPSIKTATEEIESRKLIAHGVDINSEKPFEIGVKNLLDNWKQLDRTARAISPLAPSRLGKIDRKMIMFLNFVSDQGHLLKDTAPIFQNEPTIRLVKFLDLVLRDHDQTEFFFGAVSEDDFKLLIDGVKDTLETDYIGEGTREEKLAKYKQLPKKTRALLALTSLGETRLVSLQGKGEDPEVAFWKLMMLGDIAVFQQRYKKNPPARRAALKTLMTTPGIEMTMVKADIDDQELINRLLTRYPNMFSFKDGILRRERATSLTEALEIIADIYP